MNAFIFDLDGVLVHTDDLHYQAWKRISDEMCVPFDRTINNRLRGVSRMESLEIILENSDFSYSDEVKTDLADRKNGFYRELLGSMTTEDVSDDVRETLMELKKRGYKLAVGSSSRNAKYILDQVGLTECFDAISDGTNISKSKPDPEVFLKAAEFLKADPAECIVVEDARSGIDAAKNAGMRAAGIGDAADYERADWSLRNIKDLLDMDC